MEKYNIELRGKSSQIKKLEEGNLVNFKFIDFDEFHPEDIQQGVLSGGKNPDALVYCEVEETSSFYWRVKHIEWKKYDIDFRD